MHQPPGVFQDLQLSEIAPNLQFPELANNCARPAAALRDHAREVALLSGRGPSGHEWGRLVHGSPRWETGPAGHSVRVPDLVLNRIHILEPDARSTLSLLYI